MKQYTLKRPESPVSFRVDYRRDLNEEQFIAVTAGEGPILVIAGAGSGKTRTITYRVSWLIESGVRPDQILLVTFTNKAAREMLQRVEGLTGLNLRSLWGGTYHHIANMILRKHAELLGYTKDFTILDATDSKDLIDMCIDELKIDTLSRRFPKSEVLREIFSFSVNTESSVEETIYRKAPHFKNIIDKIMRVQDFYNEKKRVMNSMDFDDLLINLKKLLTDKREMLEHYSTLFKYILVDEYQDTNKLQCDIIDLLASGHRNIIVVGDDSQSIYSFRGANFANIMDFPVRYPDARIIKLETNYRSVPQILEMANSSIKWNRRQFHKVLRPVKHGGEFPAIVPLRDVFEQAEFVAQRVLELRNEGCSLNDIAVLYRAHFQSMELQLELTRREIPFYVRSGLRFFEQAHVKDVLSFLRLTVNPKNELSLKRCIRLFSGFGKVMAERIWAKIAESKTPGSVILSKDIIEEFPQNARGGWRAFSSVFEKLKAKEVDDLPSEQIIVVLDEFYKDYLRRSFPNPQEREEDINQLAVYAERFDSTEQFLSQLALLTEVTGEDILGEKKADEVLTLTTIHQAKGLEWEHVFIIWLSEGRMPSPLSLSSPEEIEEERRLFYVGVTRAKQGLYLIYPQMIEQTHRAIIAKPSRFLQELDEGTYEVWKVD